LGVDGVVFAGFKNQKELPSLYAAADVLVVPSLSEAWGLVVNEAMCFGLPVIVSDRVGAAVDLVREGENGFIFPVGDIDRLAEDLSSVLRDSDLRRRLGQRSREKIRRWSYEEDLSGLLECLESIAVDGHLPSSAAERERQAR
jgi:glycosyltransferase involved in cell wall biosynthesis